MDRCSNSCEEQSAEKEDQTKERSEEKELQAEVEGGTGGIKYSCSLAKSIQVKAVPSAFSMRFTDIGLNMPDLRSSKWKDMHAK